MDPKNLSQLDPKLREAYERVMGVGSAPAPADPPVNAAPQDPNPAATSPTPPEPPMPQQETHQTPVIPQQPNPIEPAPSIEPATQSSTSNQAELSSPSVFGVDVPPPPPPQQTSPIDPTPAINSAPEAMEVPPPPPPPPSVAQNDPTQAAVLPQTDPGTHVNAAESPNKIMPILIVAALLVFLIVWAFFWVQLLL